MLSPDLFQFSSQKDFPTALWWFQMQSFQATLNDLSYSLQLFSQNINHCSEASPNKYSSEASISIYDKKYRKRRVRYWTLRKWRQMAPIKQIISMRWYIHQCNAVYGLTLEAYRHWRKPVSWTKDILVYIWMKYKTLDSIMWFCISIESDSFRTRQWHITLLLSILVQLVCYSYSLTHAFHNKNYFVLQNLELFLTNLHCFLKNSTVMLAHAFKHIAIQTPHYCTYF